MKVFIRSLSRLRDFLEFKQMSRLQKFLCCLKICFSKEIIGFWVICVIAGIGTYCSTSSIAHKDLLMLVLWVLLVPIATFIGAYAVYNEIK